MDLIGRDRELVEIADSLRDRRLVTIVGPGGVGKTALAKQVMSEAGPRFPLGAHLVDLTAVDDAAGVAELIAAQLGFSDFRALLASPSDQPALLIFDNCEHVLDAAAEATLRLLESCEAPVILATSRSPLDLPDELVVPLKTLGVPTPELTDSSDALHLFRLRAADHGVELDETDEKAAEICRRLDGVPLALEIAAARLRSLSAAELLNELESRPHALARPRFRGRPNHRSVAQMVGWSTAMLSPPEARFFSRLGVFVGPFTAAMAQALATDGDDTPAVDRLDELVAASLVSADTSDAVTWYRLLHPVRAIALHQLDEAGELLDRQSRWVDHIGELTVEVILDSGSGWDDQLLGRLFALYTNITSALRWTLAHEEDGETSDRPLLLLAVLWGVIHQRHTADVARLGEQVLARWDNRNSLYWADAAATVATCRNLLGDHSGAIVLADQALADVGPSPYAPASLRRVKAQADRALGRLEQSRDGFQEAAEAAEAHQTHGSAMEQWVDHAAVRAELGDIDGALAVIDRVEAEASERGAAVNEAWAMVGRGLVLFRRDAVEAEAALRASLARSRAINYTAGISVSLRVLALAQLEQGRVDEAASTVLDLLDELNTRGGLSELRTALDVGAMIAEQADHPAWANLAATAEAMAVTTVSIAVEPAIFGRARGRGTPLTGRDAFLACRHAMTTVVQRSGPAPSPSPAGHGAVQPVPAQPATGSGPEARRQGDVWQLRYEGRSVVLRVTKGLGDLAVLLASPGREVSAVDLAGSAVVVDGSAQEILDPEARRRYEQRIRDLQDDLEEAEATNDRGRAEQASAELDTLIEHLSAAVGLGGRIRKVSAEAERARSAVTQRLRATLKKIEGEHPALGAHLRASITTGAFCCYRPTPETVWQVDAG